MSKEINQDLTESEESEIGHQIMVNFNYVLKKIKSRDNFIKSLTKQGYILLAQGACGTYKLKLNNKTVGSVAIAGSRVYINFKL